MKYPISVTLLTRNSGATLRQCLESVSFCEDIVIFDGNSTDDTLAIATEFGARVFPQYETNEQNVPISNFTELRIKSFAVARHDWVFYIDSDEYCDLTLQKEIIDCVTRNDIHEVGMFDRHPLVDGKEILHAYFLPDYVARLINKKGGVVWKVGSRVHESFVYPETTHKRKLCGILFSYWPDLAACYKKDSYYLGLAKEKFIADVSRKPFFEFWRGFWKNFALAGWIFVRVLYHALRARPGTLPFLYHLRFSIYHLRTAFSPRKWFAMMTSVIRRVPNLVWGIVLVSLIIRLGMGLSLYSLHGSQGWYDTVQGDAVEYVTIAQNMIHHHAYSLAQEAPYLPNGYRSPLYPLLLIVMGVPWGFFTPMIILQQVLALLLIVWVFDFVKKEVGEKSAYVAALFVAFEPGMLFWPQQLLTEFFHLFVMFFAVTRFYSYYKTSKLSSLVWSAVWLLVATGIRPATLPLLSIFPFVILITKFSLRKKAVLHAIVIFVMSVVVAFPWSYRNYKTFGEYSVAPGFATRGSVGKYLQEYAQYRFNKPAEVAFPELGVQYDRLGEQGSVVTRLVISHFVKDPLPFFAIGAKSAIAYFVGDGWYTMYVTYVGRQESIPSVLIEQTHFTEITSFVFSQNWYYILPKILYGLVSITSLLGVIVLIYKKETRLIGLFCLVLVAYYALVGGVGSYARFRYVGQVYMWIAISGVVLLPQIKKRIP